MIRSFLVLWLKDLWLGHVWVMVRSWLGHGWVMRAKVMVRSRLCHGWVMVRSWLGHD